MPSSLHVISVSSWLMLQHHQTPWVFVMTKENGLEPSHWDTKILTVELAFSFQLFSLRKGPAKFAHSRQVKKATLSSQILVLQFFLTKQDLEHKGQTQTKPQCETQLKTKRKEMPNEKYQSIILRLLHVGGKRAESTFEVKSTFFSIPTADLAIFFFIDQRERSLGNEAKLLQRPLSVLTTSKETIPPVQPKKASLQTHHINLAKEICKFQTKPALSAHTHPPTLQHPRLILYSTASISRQRPKLAGLSRSLLLLLWAYNGLFTVGSSLPIVCP